MQHAIVVPFPLVHLKKPTPAKVSLRADVRLSIDRSIRQLPILGAQSPDDALLIGEFINDWIDRPPDGSESRTPHQQAADTSRGRKKPRIQLAAAADGTDCSALALALGENPRTWGRRRPCA